MLSLVLNLERYKSRQQRSRIKLANHRFQIGKATRQRYTRSNTAAMPWPTPMHMETRA